ncbi:N-acetylmuramoyl-L-alanine amidase family protein [Streptococcus pneumoniae]|uniref:N-acetylmuramoyl-L-alanine amidase family protein n=1 Tax=Streptococcus pneumoniae TaxID=1313 RepID=UPI000B5970D5|nr:N-acetylmuramoyl-L-alanine amidase family protein [Streptococcus pneumoniae]SNI75463.1 choline binding domain Cbp6 [Streptococcus pneumoniae]
MKSKTVLVTSLAAVTFGLVSLVDTAGALPFSAKTVQADTQTLTTAAKYYILVPKDSEVFKNWRGTANRPIIWATKTTPELSYFQESARNYIANENKSGANYIEWKGTVEEFKEAIKNLTDKKLTPNPAPIPQSDKKPTPDPTPNPQSTVPSGWSGSSYYQNGTKVTSKWIFDKNYNSYFYLDASGNYVQNAWEGDYYLKSGGYMAKKEWIYDKNYGAYYYLTPDGYYARNTWVGNYYLKSNGKMAKSEWIYDKNYSSYYYLTSEGSYARNTWVGDYYLKSNGKMAKGEWIYDNNYSSYYYLTSEGSYARNTWVGDYYLKSNGKMAVSERTPDRYQVDGSGKWISSEGTHTASSSQATSLGISLYNVNDAMTYIDIALPSTPSSSYQVAYDFALVDANTGSVSTQTQFTVTYNPSLRVFQTRHFFSATPDGSYRFVIKGKGQDGKVYDGQSVVFRVKNHRFVG